MKVVLKRDATKRYIDVESFCSKETTDYTESLDQFISRVNTYIRSLGDSFNTVEYAGNYAKAIVDTKE
jgi:hypothetical protein